MSGGRDQQQPAAPRGRAAAAGARRAKRAGASPPQLPGLLRAAHAAVRDGARPRLTTPPHSPPPCPSAAAAGRLLHRRGLPRRSGPARCCTHAGQRCGAAVGRRGLWKAPRLPQAAQHRHPRTQCGGCDCAHHGAAQHASGHGIRQRWPAAVVAAIIFPSI